MIRRRQVGPFPACVVLTRQYPLFRTFVSVLDVIDYNQASSRRGHGPEIVESVAELPCCSRTFVDSFGITVDVCGYILVSVFRHDTASGCEAPFGLLVDALRFDIQQIKG